MNMRKIEEKQLNPTLFMMKEKLLKILKKKNIETNSVAGWLGSEERLNEKEIYLG